MRKCLVRTAILAACLIAFSFGTNAQKSRTSVSAAEVTGTFSSRFAGKFKKFSNTVKIQALGGGKIRFALDLLYPYSLRNGEPMANLGSLDEEAFISGDTAVYEFQQCKITIKFVKPGTIKLTQNGTDAECGFGHNVSSDGTYLKVSGKKPKFDD